MDVESKLLKRKRGAFYTPRQLFLKYILPEIKNSLWNYTWIDLYCGEGDLIIPIVECIPQNKRESFFTDHIKCFDISSQALSVFAEKLKKLGISDELIKRNIRIADTLMSFPNIHSKYPVYHITNPPYLYKGYIPKDTRIRGLLKYFKEERKPLQDLYQVALFNDVKKGIEKMVYIIPTNFLFGDTNAAYIREIVLSKYKLTQLYIFEEKVFSDTGTNTCICFFEKKSEVNSENQVIEAVKISQRGEKRRKYTLSKQFKWRAGAEFYQFVEKNRAKHPIKFKYYLMKKEVEKNTGTCKVKVLDVNSYKIITIRVNKKLAEKIKNNILFLRTLDTGRSDGLAGLYECKATLGAEGVLVTKKYTYRTHPIQIFFEQPLSREEQLFIKFWFNYVLNKLRREYDSDFMTTYRENTKYYTRKYLGLQQARKILETCPILDLPNTEKEKILMYVKNNETSLLKAWIDKNLTAKHGAILN